MVALASAPRRRVRVGAGLGWSVLRTSCALARLPLTYLWLLPLRLKPTLLFTALLKIPALASASLRLASPLAQLGLPLLLSA